MFHTTPKSRRIELLMNNEVPTQNEIKYFLGPNLAKIFCEYANPNIKQLLGLTPPLRGVDKDLWNSPSDQLIDKESLKPPLTQKYIKACTHRGILELGEQAMRRWKSNTATKLRDSLKNNGKDTRLMFEAEKRQSVNFAISHVKHLYDIHMENLIKEHESKLESLVAKVIRKSNEKLQNIVLNQRMKVKREMMKKMKDEISYVVIQMSKEFDREFQSQKNIMITEFNRILSQEREIADSKLKDFHERRSEDLQRVEIKLNNEFNDRITDVVRVERANIKAKENIELQYLRKKVETLEDLLVEAKYVIEKFSEELSNLENPSWKVKMCQVIRQFREFMDIGPFKSIPGQVEIIGFLEILLCKNTDKKSKINDNEKNNRVEKQKLVERLDKLEKKGEKFRVIEIIDKNGEKWRPIQLIPEASQLYCTEEQLVSPIVKSETNICHDNNYLDKNPSKSITSRSTLASDESLPFVYFKDKLYVRSDYKPDAEDESSAEIKTIEELVDGDSRFILGLNDPGPHNVLIDDIREDPCSLANNKKHECNSSNDEMWQDEFQTQAQNLIRTIEQVQEELMETNEKFAESNDGKVVHDLINHLKTMKNDEKEISNKNSTRRRTNKNSAIEQTNQLACSRVKSIIRIFRLDPSLQSILIRSANNI
ncbi:hypothetical protein PV327_008570 [Microctonus hyperodae]|uniref:Uncharacterized protein n=1 Tax=Microctonus hyperodae TaxID=165561 RepID=A0AA39F3G2_MICHY|nr:hypothetical protein PV327_008570 [Microctonus hyperodae]